MGARQTAGRANGPFNAGRATALLHHHARQIVVLVHFTLLVCLFFSHWPTETLRMENFDPGYTSEPLSVADSSEGGSHLIRECKINNASQFFIAITARSG